MRKVVLLSVPICVLLASLAGIATAQTPTPPAATAPGPLHQTGSDMLWWLAVLAAAVLAPAALILSILLRPSLRKRGSASAGRPGRLSSGRGFRRHYLTHLIEQHRALHIYGLPTKAPITIELEQVYVPLHAQVADATADCQAPFAVHVGQAMAQHKRLAILGGPGSGKTTLLAHLALTFARGEASQRLGLEERRLPILIPLHRLKDALGGDSTLALTACLAERYNQLDLHPHDDFFERALRDGRCLVLLDGLDEIADAGERRQMAEWIDRLVTVYPHNRVIVTSRPAGYGAAPLQNGFAVLHVRDFIAEEVRQFAVNWYLAVKMAAGGEASPIARQRAQKTARDLVAAVEANAGVRRLAANPLLLSMIALVHQYRATLPQRRADLYAEYVEALLGYRDETRGLVERLSPGQKRSVLQPLALWMHRQKRHVVPRREMEREIGALLPQVGGNADDAAGFLDEVRERSGLLVEVGLDQYGFSHLTFQEYLAARETAEHEELQALPVETAAGEWWQEVTLLTAGLTDATPVIEALLAGTDDESCARLLLAGRCVAEAAQVAEPTRERVISRLRERLVDCTGNAFLHIGRALAGVAGKESVDFFLRLAHDDPARRQAALRLLGQMARQSNEVLGDHVVEQLLAHFRDGGLQQEAGAALAELWEVALLDRLRERDPQCSADLLMAAERILTEAMDGMMVAVPGGEFSMGGDRHGVWVAAFRIDRYLVTNAQYRRFVKATGHAPPGHWERGAIPEGRALHPVVNVTWNDAVAYAAWVGKQLPSEEEWEKAARGTDGREYPWGEWAEGRCNTGESGVRGTTPVGKFSPEGDSPYGCADMAGNVWEWTSSPWDTVHPSRVLRGGSWGNRREIARCACRSWNGVGYSSDLMGFRCASPVASLGSPSHTGRTPRT